MGRRKALLGNTNHLVDAVVGGWEISPLYVYTEGVPWTPASGSNWIVNSPLGIKAHDIQANPTSTPTIAAHPFKRLQGVNPCVAYEQNVTDPKTGISSTVVTPGPTYIEFGCTAPAMTRLNGFAVQHNVVYYGVRRGAVHEFDASISKRFAWTEGVNLQLRLDAFNLLNHPNWGNDYNNDPTSINFGSITKGPSSPPTLPRDVQLSAKLAW